MTLFTIVIGLGVWTLVALVVGVGVGRTLRFCGRYDARASDDDSFPTSA